MTPRDKELLITIKPKVRRNYACLTLLCLFPYGTLGEGLDVDVEVEASVGTRLRFGTLFIIRFRASFST